MLPSGLDKIGIAGVAVAILWFGFKALQLFAQQGRQSNDAVNRNTKSFEKLAVVLEKQSAREEKFQENVIGMLRDGHAIHLSTHQKVSELHGTLVTKRRKGDEEGG